MSNRILRDSIRTSASLNAVSAEAEVLFYRLLTVADDFGRFDANLNILVSFCFPLKARAITDEQMRTWLGELSDQGMLIVFEHEGKPYGAFTEWAKFNTMRAKSSRFPAPPNTCEHVQADASKRTQTQTTDCLIDKIGLDSDLIRIRNLREEIICVPSFAKSPPGDKSLAALIRDFGGNPDWMILHTRNAVSWAQTSSKSPYARAPDKASDPVRFLRNWLTKALAEHPPSKSNGVVSRITPPEDYERLRGK